MALAFVQGVQGSSASDPYTLPAFSSSVTAGNLIVVAVVGDNGSVDNTTNVTDNKSGNSYQRADSTLNFGNGTNMNMDIWFGQVTNGGSSFALTIAFNSMVQNGRFVAQEFSGFSSTATLDKFAKANATSTSPSSGATGTTSVADELIVGLIARAGNNSSTISLGSGYSNLTNTATSAAAGMESMVVSSTGTQTATFSLSISRAWLCAVLAFKDGSGGGGGGGNTTNFFNLL